MPLTLTHALSVTPEADRLALVQRCSEALEAQARSLFGQGRELFTQFDDESGQLGVYLVFSIVDHVRDPARELLIEDVRASVDPDVALGDEMSFSTEGIDSDPNRSLLRIDDAPSLQARWLTLKEQALARMLDN